MTRLQAAVFACVLACGSQALAQTPRPPWRSEPPPLAPPTLNVSGFVTLGLMSFTATDTFDTFGSPVGSILGGGARVGLPLGGLFVSVGGWRFSQTGERVFIFDDEVFSLGTPMEVTITPLEFAAGWRFRLRRSPQFRPYVSGGISSYGYKEVSEFASAEENVDERFTGYHLAAGAEFHMERWLGAGVELNWTSVPDAIGDAGVSRVFNETNLGGTSIRMIIRIGLSPR
jgi:hypothetical protein